MVTSRFDLLSQLLGDPIRVPRIVFDPDEPPNTPSPLMCEIGRAIDYQERIAHDLTRSASERDGAVAHAAKLRGIHSLSSAGQLIVEDMTDDERSWFAALTNPVSTSEFGLKFPLDPGEAACVAIAVSRHWVLVTDDGDALTALTVLDQSRPYERIRKLLIRAAATGLITTHQANETHSAMTAAGFWDREQPFP